MLEVSTDRVAEISTDTASCDGGDLGHPLVYISIAQGGEVECPYCGQTFRRLEAPD